MNDLTLKPSREMLEAMVVLGQDDRFVRFMKALKTRAEEMMVFSVSLRDETYNRWGQGRAQELNELLGAFADRHQLVKTAVKDTV